ncbi:MAG: hypothetical protein AB7R89_07130 [Dehalococcoidia bacterium]
MSSDGPATYAIWVHGAISPEWVDRLGGLHVRQVTAGAQPMTELVGDVVDQTALAGVLSILFDLGLPIVSVGRLAELPPGRAPPSGEQA